MTPATTQQKPTKVLPLSKIQENIASILRLNREWEADRDVDLKGLIQTMEKATAALTEAKKAYLLAQADSPLTQRIAEGLSRIEELKKEAASQFNDSLDRTWKDSDGAGFQFRPKSVTTIADQPALALYLAQNKLWAATGANLSVDPKLVGAIMQDHALPGVAVGVDVTVAIYQPRSD